jgi:hypothetical protein
LTDPHLSNTTPSNYGPLNLPSNDVETTQIESGVQVFLVVVWYLFIYLYVNKIINSLSLSLSFRLIIFVSDIFQSNSQYDQLPQKVEFDYANSYSGFVSARVLEDEVLRHRTQQTTHNKKL